MLTQNMGIKLYIILNLNSLTFRPRISSLRRAFTVFFFVKPFLLRALTKPASHGYSWKKYCQLGTPFLNVILPFGVCMCV